MFEVHLANAEEQENQAHQVIAKEAVPTPQLDLRWKKMHCVENIENWERIWELRGCCLEQEDKRNSQGKDPKTLQENSQGRDPNTLERNSQGEDPRTLKENTQGGTSVLLKQTARERTREPLKNQ